MKNIIEVSLYNYGKHAVDTLINADVLNDKNLVPVESLPRLLPKDRNKKLYRIVSDPSNEEKDNEEIEDNDYVIAVDLM